MHVLRTKMTYVRSRSSKSLPGDPKVTSESTQSDSRCSQSEPKGSQGTPNPKGTPGPPKPPQMRSKTTSDDKTKKQSRPSCENTIIYYVFEGSLCENHVIYYVFVRSGILIFLKMYENTIPVHVFEGPAEPVLAWEREAR